MKLSDLSVRRPVFASVISLLLIVLGLAAMKNLPLRELPDIDAAVVTVQTVYRGADAAVIESRITKPLEDAVSGIEGIRTLSSTSQTGQSSVSIEFNTGRDIDAAANDVRDAVSRVVGRLPVDADPPQVFKNNGNNDVILWFNLSSPTLSKAELTDFARRHVIDRLSAVDGVANVVIGGEQRYAMRVWLDRSALAARGLTVGDVEGALNRENVELPAGSINSTTRDFTLRVLRGYETPEQFAALTVARTADGQVVRLGDVARVELGADEPRNDYRGNGTPQLGLGIVKTSTANDLAVARGAKAVAEEIGKGLPSGLSIGVAYDATIFVDTALDEVYKTLAQAIVLVLVVIYLFLGSARAALIPAVTVPVCTITACAALYALGFSINLLTLLALVLSIGLVVDDAIVVLENSQRRIDLGESRLVAAFLGTREVGFAVLATTLVLVAVFLPVGFMSGFTGRLFRELAVTIAAAVAISGLVALSLTPMMCSKLLVPHRRDAGLTAVVDRLFGRLRSAYERRLEAMLARPRFAVVAVLAALVASVGLARALPHEVAPTEDRGALVVTVTGPEGASFEWTTAKVREVERRLLKLIDAGVASRVNMRVPQGRGASTTQLFHTGQVILLLSPWNQRSIGASQLIEQLRRELADIPGVRITPTMRQGLSRGYAQPLQFVLQGPNYATLAGWRDTLAAEMATNPKLYAIDNDYKETQPQIRVAIDRARAADLGVSVGEISRALETLMGGRRVTTFSRDGEEYDVVVQADAESRRNPADLANIQVRASSGRLIPLANLVELTDMAAPGALNRYGRQRAITLSASLTPDYSLGEAIDYMREAAARVLPKEAMTDTRGDSRDLADTSTSVAITFGLALLVVYLVLAAQFESFVHPFTIMLCVPLAVFGALLGLKLFGSTLNLYSQIGIIMLVGLAAKNGILIVEFANQLRDRGMNLDAALRESASVRLRPILMTSIATLVGALPLMLAHGAGAQSRATIGIVVVFGVSVSTFLSLFIVPACYQWLARYTGSPEQVSRELERQLPESTALETPP